MDHKITIRLSDKEYEILNIISKEYKNNKSKAIREMISSYSDLIMFWAPTRKILEEYKNIKDELPFTEC